MLFFPELPDAPLDDAEDVLYPADPGLPVGFLQAGLGLAGYCEKKCLCARTPGDFSIRTTPQVGYGLLAGLVLIEVVMVSNLE